MADDVRWIRTSALLEDDGSIGTVCIHQATEPAAIRRHAERADLPAGDIVAVADTVVVRPDPVPSAAWPTGTNHPEPPARAARVLPARAETGHRPRLVREVIALDRLHPAGRLDDGRPDHDHW